MARICQCLTLSKGLELVNDIISSTNIQGDLIKWKERHTSNFDQSNWSTYGNFRNMYEHNIEEMVEARITAKRDVSTWMDREGNVVSETEGHGCKVTHDLIHPEMCAIGDKVGGNVIIRKTTVCYNNCRQETRCINRNGHQQLCRNDWK